MSVVLAAPVIRAGSLPRFVHSDDAVLALFNLTSFVQTSGYAAIFLLSVLQSCCVPTSSELTFGFAGVLASEGKLDVALIILVGVIGEVVGAYIAWALGRSLGREFVDRYGKYILLSHHDLDRAEAWYARHERFGVLGTRLLPVIRNFVAVPAGVAEVPPVRFGVLTALGSLIWITAWTFIGYGVGDSYKSITHDFSDVGYVLGALAVAAIAYVIFHRYRAYKAAVASGAGPRSTDAQRPPEVVQAGDETR